MTTDAVYADGADQPEPAAPLAGGEPHSAGDDVQLVPTGYDHPDVQRLVDELQQEYHERYGDGDDTPVEPGEFSPPDGTFLVAYIADEPVAMGGWRRLIAGYGGPGDNPVEVKRMYVVPAARGRGLARRILAELEDSAAAAGADWVVLMSGHAQPEALQLYASEGYEPVPKFGYYACEPDAVHLGKLLVSDPA